MEKNKGKIKRVTGPLVVAEDLPEVKMYELVRVGNERIIGEVIKIKDNDISIQVYEDTAGVGPGEPVELTGESLSVELGPGLISNVYDGIQRPLDDLIKKSGPFIRRGLDSRALNPETKWDFNPQGSEGDEIVAGDIIGEISEKKIFVHKIMNPPTISGKIEFTARKGNYTIDEVIARIKGKDLPSGRQDITMSSKWPIREPRTTKEEIIPNSALVTGQRVIDTFCPIAKGGTGSVPGPFGSGKTVVQHQLAKWSDADVIIFIGCGERGNEMTDLLNEFPTISDPTTGRPLMEITAIVANTSNLVVDV